MRRKFIYTTALLVCFFMVLPITSFASNMGFKLSKEIVQAGSLNWNMLSVPFYYKSTAKDVWADVDGATNLNYVGKWNIAADNWTYYSGGLFGDFPINPGEALILVPKIASADIVIVGSHDPSYSISLTTGPGRSWNIISHPYHMKSTTAKTLWTEITNDGCSLLYVGKYNTATDNWTYYSGGLFGDFTYNPGDAAIIVVSSNCSWIPDHY